MAKNKSESQRNGGKGGKITRRENVHSQSCRARGGGGAERGRGGGEMEGSISNFSAEFTVDSFPIRLG